MTPTPLHEHAVLVLPPVSESRISTDLRVLTEHLITRHGASTTGGLLGGEYGYGATYENDTFLMAPYCWCDREGECMWCTGCTCTDAATRYYLDGAQTDANTFYSRGGHTRGHTERVTALVCASCKGLWEPAPNFLHKPSGSKVYWYKYIGRGMTHAIHAPWSTITADVYASLDDPRTS